MRSVAAGKATVAKSATVDVWDRVASLRPAQPEIPEGAFTLKEYMTRFQISMGVARRELARLMASGAVATEMGKNTAAGCAGHPERILADMNDFHQGPERRDCLPAPPASDHAIRNLWPMFTEDVHARLIAGSPSIR